MTRRFQQMQVDARTALAAMRLQGMSLPAVGPALGVSPGALSCELSRSFLEVNQALNCSQRKSHSFPTFHDPQEFTVSD
jgi:hypothetical protein